MNPETLVLHIVLGGLLGIVGQGARVIVGLKKLNDQASATSTPFGSLFSTSTLLLSLLIGFVAGVLAMIGMSTTELKIDRNTLVALIAAGYAGTDFIEGFVKRNIRAASPEPHKPSQ